MNELHVTVLASIDWHTLATHWILTLAHFLWQGAALGLLAAVILAAFRDSSPRVRHGICLVALLSCIPCLVVTWMSVDGDGSASVPAEIGNPAVAVTDRPAPRFPDPRTVESLNPVSVGTEVTLAPHPREGDSAAAIPVSGPPIINGSVVSRVAPVLAVGYFLGVLLLLARTSLGLWGGRRLRILSQPIQNPGLIGLIEQQARQVGLKSAPLVAYCANVAVPMVIGLLKPIVLLPAALITKLETDQLAAILAHEFAHIRRHDLIVNLLQRVIESLLFFHPAVWWLSRRVSLERENCCDDLASAAGSGNLHYAEALLRMAEVSLPQRSKKLASQLMALSADGRNTPHFTRRIERLLNIPRTPRLAVSRMSAVFAVVLSVLSVGVLAQITHHKSVAQQPVAALDDLANDEVKLNDADGSVIETAKTPSTGTQQTEPNAPQESTTAETGKDTPERPATPYFEFLQSYPKLYALSLEMTEVQFLTIVHQEKLKLRRNPDGPSYWIPTDDGHIVIVMFGNNGSKCSGVQRIQGGLNEEVETPPAIVDSNGIYWSEFVQDGYRVGAKLLAEGGQLKAGDKLVVQYYLLNESEDPQSVSLVPSRPVFPNLTTDHRIELSLFPAHEKPREFSIAPDQFLEDPSHRVEIDTTGFLPGDYHVMARNFFWRPAPEEAHRKSGFPARMAVPLTIVAEEGNPQEAPAEGSASAADGIDWGDPVAGLQVGSRFVGESTPFLPGASPQVQLFVRNVSRNPIRATVFLPHPTDGWLINVENPQGDHIRLERTYISMFSPQESFHLPLKAGEMVPLTGIRHVVNEAPRDIANSSLRIERKKPDDGFWKGGILISQGGSYCATHTVSMQRDDTPGVRLSIDSGVSSFRVDGPALNKTDSAPDAPEKGLEFLKPYPRLYSLSLKMTEPEFLKIAAREKLKFQKSPDGETYEISTGDGHTVLVMFGNDGNTCSGIQRIRGDSLSEKPQPELVADEDGIYWSRNAFDGFRVGAKVLAKNGRLTAGEKLVVQYVLKNETERVKTVQIHSGDPLNPMLEAGNRIVLSQSKMDPTQPRRTLQPGEILTDPKYRASVETTGFGPGNYQVAARNFYWNAGSERGNQGTPMRVSELELPLTILLPEGSKPIGAAVSSQPRDIDWGRNVMGIEVGSRVLGESNLFEPGSAPEVQLFVTNITEVPVEIEVFLTHPKDEWLLNIENREGENVPLERFRGGGAFFRQESFQLQLEAGATVPLTGNKHRVNESPRVINNSSFRIERDKPKSDFWQGGILLSEGGVYTAQHTVFIKRSDIPGVRLSVNSGKSIFRVSRAEAKVDDSAKNDKTSEGQQNPGEQGGEPGAAAIRLWKARLVDGLTGKPLPGITVRVQGAVEGETEPQPMDLVSDRQGILNVPLRDGTTTFPDLRTLGWWGGTSIGYSPPAADLKVYRRPATPGEPFEEIREAPRPKPDPDVPRDIKIWPGDIVTGRLLYPDKSPAAGVLLNVGVYINHVEWKKRLGMNLMIYSFDHGEWPNWNDRIITNDDGTFATTVPPEEARSWVRIGTTGLGFGAINPDQIDDQGTGKALATCVPFEAELGGNSPGFGYETVAIGNDNAAINFGTLELKAGTRVRGRVLDADGNGLAGVYLPTAGPHGPYAGRSTWSGEDGRFEYLPVEGDSLIIKPDARRRDADRKVISRDVQAVFVERPMKISEEDELIVQAVPHVDLEFEWIDRRTEKSDRVSYYGAFRVFGRYRFPGEEPVYWSSETSLIERDGRKYLTVKIPRDLTGPQLTLSSDRLVTPSYADEAGRKSGPGNIELGDITQPIHRTIYGDEPKKPERSGN